MKDQQRFKELDALRGLAALSVFIGHWIGLFPDSNWVAARLNHTPLHILWDGSAAVFLFFVLSGFVLALPYTGENARPIDPASFLVRRAGRLYPAYWFGLILALGLRAWVLDPKGLQGLSHWAAGLYVVPLGGWKNVARHFLMVAPGLDTHAINPVIWSLIVEMKVSIVFPLILAMVRWVRSPKAGFVLGVSIALVLLPIKWFVLIALFVAGAILARFRSQWMARSASLGSWSRILLWSSAALLYGGRWIFSSIWDPVLPLMNGAGALLLIVMFLSTPAISRFTRLLPVHFLGEISYGLYLFHFPILIIGTSVLWPRTHSLIVCGSVALALTLLAAKGVYRWVEQPAIRHSRRLAKSFQPVSVLQ